MAATTVSKNFKDEYFPIKKYERTFASIFAEPARASIAWRGVENLFPALGAETTEGSGSRILVVLNGVRAVFHEPHPEKEIGKPAAREVRRFLGNAGEAP